MTEALRDLIRDDGARLIGPIRQEILSGIREPAQFARLQQYLRAFEDEPLETEDFERAARCSNQCRARGISGSGTDFLMCAVAIQRGWQVFTADNDFQAYTRALALVLFQPR